MATLEELIANVSKIRRFVGVYLDVKEPTPKQRDALRVDLVQLDRNLAALTAALAPTLRAATIEPIEAPPVAEPSNRISSKIYGAWGMVWFQESFPEALADYPPVVHLIDPARIAEKATGDGVLAEVCAAGFLSTPGGLWPELGDWSLFTGLVTTTGDAALAQLWIMGELVATTDVVDDNVWTWAADNGLDLA